MRVNPGAFNRLVEKDAKRKENIEREAVKHKCKTIFGALLDGVEVPFNGNTYGMSEDGKLLIRVHVNDKPEFVESDFQISFIYEMACNISLEDFRRLGWNIAMVNT